MRTEDVARHDECPRFATWSNKYALPTFPLAQALNDSLRVGLLHGPAKARESFLKIAADPGLDIQAYNVYDISVHHAALLEVVCAYLTADGPWISAGEVDGFACDSFLLPDGRLRRVILCSAHNALREQEEIHSWRTMADVCVTNRPMLLNLVVIGQSRKGFRPSPWTQGFIHPENGILRVRRIPSEKTGPNPKFTDNWRRVYREQTDQKPKDWLLQMQKDDAFEGLIYSRTVDVPLNRSEILANLKRIELGSTEMRRSACFRFSPCPMAKSCHGNATPEFLGWKEK